MEKSIGVELYVAQCDFVSGWTVVKGLIAFKTEAYILSVGERKKPLTCLRHVSEYTMYYRLILAPKAEILHLTLGLIIIASGTVW